MRVQTHELLVADVPHSSQEALTDVHPPPRVSAGCHEKVRESPRPEENHRLLQPLQILARLFRPDKEDVRLLHQRRQTRRLEENLVHSERRNANSRGGNSEASLDVVRRVIRDLSII